MRSRKWLGAAGCIIAGVCFVGSYALSDDKKAPDQSAGSGADAAMMEKWQKAMTPGPHHKALEPMAGNFKYVMKFRMDPAQPWQTTEGNCEGQMILGGRYLAHNVRGSMMGQQFEGMGCMGYDNVKDKHFSAWIDNMGTGLTVAEGTCSEDGKTLTFEGEMADAMSGEMVKYKTVYQIKNNDNFNMTMSCPSQSGEMFECMNIDYTRVQ